MQMIDRKQRHASSLGAWPERPSWRRSPSPRPARLSRPAAAPACPRGRTPRLAAAEASTPARAPLPARREAEAVDARRRHRAYRLAELWRLRWLALNRASTRATDIGGPVRALAATPREPSQPPQTPHAPRALQAPHTSQAAAPTPTSSTAGSARKAPARPAGRGRSTLSGPCGRRRPGGFSP